jgi:tRNA(Arg) A34 adenosine deaminase TadA
VNLQQQCELVLPGWMSDFIVSWVGKQPAGLAAIEQRMQLAIALSAENVRKQTGGPFGAIVVAEDSGLLVSAGVNLVTSLHLSMAHAEIVALSMAQRAVNSWDLGSTSRMQLVTSCEPCAMCFGAVPWSGVSSIVCGARKEDAAAAGFDEGDKPDDWAASLRKRGIEVRLDVLRDEAAQVLRAYANQQGAIYNPGKSPKAP